MDKKALQAYAEWAKDNLEEQIEVTLKTLGINSEKDIKEARKVGEYTIIDGDANSYPASLKDKRDHIVRIVKTEGYKPVIEEFAYTWFNRIVALRFMEIHDFLPHGFRVLSSRDGGFEPEILKNVAFVKDALKLDIELVNNLKAQGKIDEAYRYVLFRQCNALSGFLPMLFDAESDYLELLLPKALLKGDTFITKIREIDEADFLNDVEVIGWLYQFYVAGNRETYRKQKTYTKNEIPTVSQVFTPDDIVRYMTENSIGRLWLESYPNSSIKSSMKYYVEDAKQEPEVQRKIDAIKYTNVNPEDIRIIEPCCGSGHILVYIFDLLYKMYEEKGYQAREIPTLILKNNLVGLEIDKRAAQLASFSLVMKARSLNPRFFSQNYYVIPKVIEIWDSRALLSYNYERIISELKLLTNEEISNIKWLVETFRYGKTLGSLIKVEKKDFAAIKKSLDTIYNNAVATIFNTEFLGSGLNCLYHLLTQAEAMSAKYDVMITNPPYIGSKKLHSVEHDYVYDYYPKSKDDMFAMFMDTNFVKRNGYVALVNPDSWMFLESYQGLRDEILSNQSIINMIHLGMGSFDAVVQTTSFVIRNLKAENYTGRYFRYADNDNESILEFISKKENINDRNQSVFYKINQNPIAYWCSDKTYEIFSSSHLFGEFGETKKGVLTGKDELFGRYWYEVDFTRTCDYNKDHNDMIKRNKKWIMVTSGGAYRKWYGNFEWVINMENNGKAITDNKENSCRLRDPKYYFKECITWSEISSKALSIRYVPQGILFGNSGPCCFFHSHLHYFMGLLNTNVTYALMKVLSPTLTFGPEQLKRLPVVFENVEYIENLVKENIELCKKDWDFNEFSWKFARHPLVAVGSLPEIYSSYVYDSKIDFELLLSNETEINRQFINMYGLQEEMSEVINPAMVTFRHPEKTVAIKSLISYLIGIEMGRYSLDVEGLAYAGGEWNSMKYVSYQPDNDGIIPVYTQLGMQDGLTARIIKLIKHIYGEDTYRENIDFIAEALGKNNNESSEETLNRYLNDSFYADHVKIYQKRPIYWMFSSGKNDAFKCLIYIHRYNEDTLARINSKYFLNESARINAEVEDVRIQLETAEGREKLRLDKLYKTFIARQKEMIEYGQVLDHMANQYIVLDLDDGVKVNYAKFQGIEIVNDNGAKVKKDLLVPIK